MQAAIGVLCFVEFAKGGGCVPEVFGGGSGEIGSSGGYEGDWVKSVNFFSKLG